MIELDCTNGILRIRYIPWEQITSPECQEFSYIDNPHFPMQNYEIPCMEDQLYAQMLGWA